MLCGIVSDVHSNLEALTAALAAIGEVDELLCPGDIIGYGPDPNACCEALRERNVAAVLGNHDAAVAGRISIDWFNPAAREALAWTCDALAPDNKRFIAELPLVLRSECFVMVHGTLNEPEDFNYLTSPLEAGPTFAGMQPHEICFIGHSHIAEYYVRKSGELWADRVAMPGGGTIDLKPGFHYIVNSGSVGQPRDFDPRLAAGIYDTESRVLQIMRVAYPIGVTQEKMAKSGLPETLARRLEFGA